jgi:hypothetical protein
VGSVSGKKLGVRQQKLANGSKSPASHRGNGCGGIGGLLWMKDAATATLYNDKI